MQPIETALTLRQYHYTQVERTGDVAIYQQRHTEADVVRFEVIRIRVVPPTTWPHGTVSPEREVYPSAGKWGQDGWTCFTLLEAQTLAQTLQ